MTALVEKIASSGGATRQQVREATAKALGFDTADEIAIVFCGSKKSLASGVPMAQILFAGQAVGLLVLPLMIFHQIQLVVCSVIASRLSRDELPADAAAD